MTDDWYVLTKLGIGKFFQNQMPWDIKCFYVK